MPLNIKTSILSISFFILLLTLPFLSFGQQNLKSITSYRHNNLAEINWEFNENISHYIKRINIQRSYDSTTSFSTIGSALNPESRINKYLDKKPFPSNNYYRLFILFKDGSYAFSKTIKSILIPDIYNKDNLDFANQDNLKNYFQPSLYVYTNPKGNVNIRLPYVKKNNYAIKFYDASDRFLFELRKPKKPLLIIDKANFFHSGWFHYKIFKNGHIFEKWKFYLPDLNL